MIHWSNEKKLNIALVVAILFHVCGLAGILFGNREWFLQLTWLNLLLMTLLIIWTQDSRSLSFWIFALVCMTAGFLFECVGVNTGWMFGQYTYGKYLGIKYFGVPVMIGLQWFLITYISGQTLYCFYEGIFLSFKESETVRYSHSGRIMNAGIVVDAALLATFFDWIIEPVAVKLGYWHWLNVDAAPVSNYISWFVISCLFQYLFNNCRDTFNKPNHFAVHLFFIQILFFVSLRLFLK